MGYQLLLVARRIDRDLTHRLPPTEAQNGGMRQQIHRPGLDQEIDIQIGRHRHFHTPQAPEHDGIHGGIPQGHHGRAGKRAARANQPGVKRHTRHYTLGIEPVDAQVDILCHGQPGPNQRLHLWRGQCRHLPLPRTITPMGLPTSCTALCRHRTMPGYYTP